MAEQAMEPPSGGGADPSMEDILASIRRILSEDEAASAPAAIATPEPAADVLTLDESMMVRDLPPQPPTPGAPHEKPPQELPLPQPSLPDAGPAPAPQHPHIPPAPDRLPDHAPVPAHDEAAGMAAAPAAPLVRPEAAAAAASSVGSLLRTLGTHRQSLAVSRGGPTLEDLVREELRPVLKAWLDEHLPPLVERLVRAEIERVVGRATDL